MSPESVDEFLRLAESYIAELGQQARQRVEEAEQEAREAISRWHQLRDELESSETRRDELVELLESLPLRHSRAVLSDDPEEEERVKTLHRNAEAELQTLEDRLPEIRRELKELCPREGIPGARGVVLFQRGRVSEVYTREIAPLERVRAAVGRAVTRATAPLDAAQNKRNAEAESLATVARWEAEQRQREAS